uniref:Uncharacterized protein n=1 Tax=Kalanchoe fedtschenkoi TaxID=63787 RepID=A0A7N0T5S8_KALFE
MSNSGPLDILCEALVAVTGPLSCSFLSAGQAFTGTQSVSLPDKEEESWKLSVRILGCDFERGYICGSMKALYVLAQDAPPVVETFWEGEIVDTRNFTFHSDKMHVRPVVDMQNWLRFNCFAQLEFHSGYEGAQVDLSMHQYIYMVRFICTIHLLASTPHGSFF